MFLSGYFTFSGQFEILVLTKIDKGAGFEKIGF